MARKTITYIGPHDAVDVDVVRVGDERIELGLTVANGESVELDAEVADELLKQESNWTAGGKRASRGEEE